MALNSYLLSADFLPKSEQKMRKRSAVSVWACRSPTNFISFNQNIHSVVSLCNIWTTTTTWTSMLARMYHTHTHTGLPALLVIPQTHYKIFSSSFTLSPSSSSNWIWIKMAFPFLLCFFFVWLKTDLPREIIVSGGEKSHLRKNVFTNPKQQSPSPSHPPSLPPLSRPFFFFLYVHLIA